jgi:branched-chain amino acid transport system substrate-binding protein
LGRRQNFPPFQEHNVNFLRLGRQIWAALLLSGVIATTAAAQVTIGCYLPMTGPAAAMGQMVWDGIQIAHKLKPKVLDQEVKLALVDTRSDKMEAANAVSRLIEKDGVAAIIGEVITLW